VQFAELKYHMMANKTMVNTLVVTTTGSHLDATTKRMDARRTSGAKATYLQMLLQH
jgi:hypothetical protein